MGGQGSCGALRAAAVVGLLVAGGYWRIATYNERHNHITLVATGHEHVSPEQQQWGEDFYQRSLTAALKNGWFDIDKAFAQGFQADRINGTHYPNLQNMFDDVILDPERPEWLIYYDTPDGKMLMGFMYFTRELYEVGPTPAGPLAQWHFHPYVTPRCAVKGLWTVGRPDGNGVCAEGIPVSRTPEMFHVWFVDHPLGRFTEMNIVPETWEENWFNAATLHPISVHFAIALFVIAVLLDLVAIVTGRREYHRVAWVNLALAAVATVAAVTAGMTAELALKPTHEAHQTLDTHKLLAFDEPRRHCAPHRLAVCAARSVPENGRRPVRRAESGRRRSDRRGGILRRRDGVRAWRRRTHGRPVHPRAVQEDRCRELYRQSPGGAPDGVGAPVSDVGHAGH